MGRGALLSDVEEQIGGICCSCNKNNSESGWSSKHCPIERWDTNQEVLEKAAVALTLSDTKRDGKSTMMS